MKKIISLSAITTLTRLCLSLSVSAQTTLYAPGGTVGNITGTNVGIGTSTPTSYMASTNGLALYGTYPAVSFANSVGKTWLFYGYGSGGDNSFRLWESTSGGSGIDRITILPGGNLSIGTNQGNAKLQVGPAVANGTDAMMIGGTSGGVLQNTLGTNWAWAYSPGADKWGVGFTTSYVTKPASPVFTAQSNGNVGIGTTGPTQKLQIDNGNVFIRGNGNFQSVGNEAILYLGDNNSYIKNIFGGGVRIGTYCWDSPGYVDAISINSCGYVGIGTSNPGSFKLAVEGKIGAREIKVTAQNPFPDFVFEKDYELLPIEELGIYLEKNKHLPGIPSAEQVKKDGGINLGEMSQQHLAKTEELYLYMIQLNEKMEKLEKENQELKSHINKLEQK